MLLFATLLAVSCSKPVVPEAMRGEWKQTDRPETRLRFEQSADGPRVSLSTGFDWFGPLELESDGARAWKFTIAEIVTTSGNNTTRMAPPQATTGASYLIDQKGRQLIHKYRAFAKGGKVKVREEGAALGVDGLWADVEVKKWDDDGKPVEEKLTPLTVRFTR